MNGKSWIVTVVSVLAAVAGIVLYVGDLKSRISALETKRSRPDPFTGKDAIVWSIELQKSNPHLIVPTPKHQPDE